MFDKDVKRRFLKNKTGVFSLAFIILCTLIAFFSYTISPDNSVNGNRQILEHSGKKAGYSSYCLEIEMNKEESMWSWLVGDKNRYSYIPLQSESSVATTADGYIATDVNGKTHAFQSSDFEGGVESHIVKTTYLLGSDDLGRDILSRLFIGTRISLSVGLLAVSISLVIGISLGAIAGYFGGKVDDIIMLLINTVWSIPTLLLVFAIIIVVDRGFFPICLAVGLTMWVDVARIVRGQVIQYRNIAFVEATKSFGFSDSRIIIKHILPNILGPILVTRGKLLKTFIRIQSNDSFIPCISNNVISFSFQLNWKCAERRF